MRLSDVLTLTRARFVSATGSPNLEVRAGFAADLMSDALRYDLSGALLVSGLATPTGGPHRRDGGCSRPS